MRVLRTGSSLLRALQRQLDSAAAWQSQWPNQQSDGERKSFNWVNKGELGPLLTTQSAPPVCYSCRKWVASEKGTKMVIGLHVFWETAEVFHRPRQHLFSVFYDPLCQSWYWLDISSPRLRPQRKYTRYDDRISTSSSGPVGDLQYSVRSQYFSPWGLQVPEK